MKSLKHIVFASVVMLVTMLPAFNASAANTITFDNQSGKLALVKLVGPTAAMVDVANGAKQTTTAAAGHYTIKVRYGTPGAYAYSKGDEFDVKETASSESAITITLHAVVNGNYGTRPITEAEFGADEAGKSSDKLKESEIDTAWARFVLNEEFIRPGTRDKVNQMVAVSVAFAAMMPSGAVSYIEPAQIDFRPIPLSQVIRGIGKWQEEGEEGDYNLYKWGKLALKCDKRTRQVVTLGFTKEFLVSLPKEADYLEEARKCLRASAPQAGPATVPTSHPAAGKPGSTTDPVVIKAEYSRVQKTTPPLAELNKADLPKGDKFSLEAGTAELVGENTLRITLVTKQADLPPDASCMVICMSDGANLDNTIKLLRVFGDGIGYTGAKYDTFKQTLFWKQAAKTPKQVHIFEGDMSDVIFENLGFNRYIGVQVCTGKRAPAKPSSNVIWIRLPDQKK